MLAVFATTTTYSQCKDFHLSYPCRLSPSEKRGMVESSQSKSGLLEANKEYLYEVMLLRKKDYKFIFCTEEEFKPVHFVIMEKESGKVYFDNSTDEYVETIGFTTDEGIVLTIKVTLLAIDNKFKDFSDNRGCLGMPIRYRQIPKMGIK